MKSTKIELLAPAGNKEAFVGAINAGANAIYLSGKNYGARKYANNFAKEEILDLIEYAHLRNVKVYVTVNTLIFEDELTELFEYCDFLVENNVDALIIQDLGIIDALSHRYPDTEIHASTQMNTFNEYQLQFLADLGVKRVILARETSINDIQKMLDHVEIDVEVFVHGALCVAYSGNCLFSSLRGGRSGNRGECAQPCRLKYSLYREDDLVEKDSYLLSTKDLMTINELDKIISSGVKSLKIEGRMRKPEYVIATVKAYREAIDHILENKPFDLDKRITELLSVFNREYTKGYILNEKPYDINNAYRPNHQGIEVGTVTDYNRGKTKIKLSDKLRVGDGIRIIGSKDIGGKVDRILLNKDQVMEANKNDIITIDILGKAEIGSKVMKTLDSSLVASLTIYLDDNYGIVPLNIKLSAYVGKKLKLEMKTDTSDLISIESSYTVEKASNLIQDENKLAKQLAKIGNTCFYIKKVDILTDGNCFVPNKVLNELRREGIKALEEALLRREPKQIVQTFNKLTNGFDYTREPNLFVKVENQEQYDAAVRCGIKDIAIYTLKTNLLLDNSINNHLMLNRIWYELPKKNNFQSVIIRDFGALSLSKKTNVIADHTINATNSFTLETLFKNNVQRVCLSLENGLENTKKMIQEFTNKHGFNPNLEILAYGNPDLMITKYCPITKSEGVYKQNCMLCENHDYALVNDFQESFRLIRENYCNLRILHSKTINLIDNIPDILTLGIKTVRLDFTTETAEEVQMIIKAFQNRISNKDYFMPLKKYTYGRFKK